MVLRTAGISVAIALALMGRAWACDVCVRDGIVYGMPFFPAWLCAPAVWLVAACVILWRAGLLKRQHVTESASLLCLLIMGWFTPLAFVIPIVLAGLFVWALVLSARLLLKGADRCGWESQLVYLTAGMAIVLLGTAIRSTHQASQGGVRYYLGRLERSSLANSLCTRVARENLLSREELSEMLAGDSGVARRNAMRIVGRMKDPTYVPLLLAHLGGAPQDRSEAISALSSLGFDERGVKLPMATGGKVFRWY